MQLYLPNGMGILYNIYVWIQNFHSKIFWYIVFTQQNRLPLIDSFLWLFCLKMWDTFVSLYSQNSIVYTILKQIYFDFVYIISECSITYIINEVPSRKLILTNKINNNSYCKWHWFTCEVFLLLKFIDRFKIEKKDQKYPDN